MIALQQQQLFNKIDILPIDLKTKIVDKILNSIQPITQSIDDLWIKEANKRQKEVENNKIKLVDGNEVFAKIAQRLKV